MNKRTWLWNVEEATRAFEKALLLDPTNMEGKMSLAACLRNWTQDHTDEARNYYRETSGQVRRITVTRGLVLDSIASLCISKKVLWIGYGHNSFNHLGLGVTGAGGLGSLDLTTRLFSAFMPSISDKNVGRQYPIDKPTRCPVIAIKEGIANDLWLSALEPEPILRHYRIQDNAWVGPSSYCGNPAADRDHLYTTSSGVSTLDFSTGKWSILKAIEELPGITVTTLFPDGRDLGVGGKGYVAKIDSEKDKVLKFAFVRTIGVDKIRIGGGYVWAQFDWHLYRSPIKGREEYPAK